MRSPKSNRRKAGDANDHASDPSNAFNVSKRSSYGETPSTPSRGGGRPEIDYPLTDLGTVARVKHLKKSKINVYEKLPLIIDSSGYYIMDKSKEGGISAFLDTITPLAAQETMLETTRQMNYKGGINVLVELEDITGPDGSQTSKTEKIADNVEKYRVLPSNIRLTPVSTYSLPTNHEFSIFFRNSHLMLEYPGIQKLCFSSIVNAIGFYKIYKGSTDYAKKLELIEELIGRLISIGFDFPPVDTITSENLKGFLDSLKTFCDEHYSFEYVDKYVKEFKENLVQLDTRSFLEVNSGLIRDTLGSYTNELSPFYYFYRMGVLSDNIHQQEISSPTLNKAGFKREGKANKQISDSFVAFLNLIINRMPQKLSVKEVKQNVRDNIKELYDKYSAVDSLANAILSDTEKDLFSLEKSEDFQRLLSELKNAESEFLKKIGFEHVTVNDTLDIFKDNILNGSDNISDSIIDKKFDGNDFAICWDAVTNGLPVLTQNADMLTQIRLNLGRSFLLGRDVQIIIIDDLVKYFTIEKKFAGFSAADITVKHIWLYCREKLDMNKMWGMTSSKASKAFEESYTNGTFDVTNPEYVLKKDIEDPRSPVRKGGTSLIHSDVEYPKIPDFATIFREKQLEDEDLGSDDESNQNKKGPGSDSKP